MANFFKKYQAQVREKHEQERRAEQEERRKIAEVEDYINGLRKGQKVKYSFLIDVATGKPVIYEGYFCADAETHIWVSETKEDALRGRGRTVDKRNIIVPRGGRR